MNNDIKVNSTEYSRQARLVCVLLSIHSYIRVCRARKVSSVSLDHLPDVRRCGRVVMAAAAAHW